MLPAEWAELVEKAEWAVLAQLADPDKPGKLAIAVVAPLVVVKENSERSSRRLLHSRQLDGESK